MLERAASSIRVRCAVESCPLSTARPWSPASEQSMTHRKASQDQSCCCSPTGGMGKILRPSSESLGTRAWPTLPDVCNSTLMLLVSGSASTYRDQMLAEGGFYFCSYEEVSKHAMWDILVMQTIWRSPINNQTLIHVPVITINPLGHQTGLGRNPLLWSVTGAPNIDIYSCLPRKGQHNKLKTFNYIISCSIPYI